MTLSAQPHPHLKDQVRVRITYGPVEAQVDEHFQHAKHFAGQLLATAEAVERAVLEGLRKDDAGTDPETVPF